MEGKGGSGFANWMEVGSTQARTMCEQLGYFAFYYYLHGAAFYGGIAVYLGWKDLAWIGFDERYRWSAPWNWMHA